MNFAVVVVAYALMVLVSRFVVGDASIAPWQYGLTVGLGVAWGAQPTAPPGQKAVPSFASLVAFLLLVALCLAAAPLFVLLPSAVFVTAGVRGLVTGRITLGGRVGPGREYTGSAAYFQSAFCLASGAAGIVFVALGLFE